MSRSKRFDPVVKMAGENERTAGSRVGESRRTLVAQEARLKELHTFRQDYRIRLKEMSESGLDAGKLRDYHRFLARLDDAVKQQEMLVTSCNHDVSNKVAEWSDKRTRVKALDKVVDRYQKEERTGEQRREQREIDDRATSQFRNRRR